MPEFKEDPRETRGNPDVRRGGEEQTPTETERKGRKGSPSPRGGSWEGSVQSGRDLPPKPPEAGVPQGRGVSAAAPAPNEVPGGGFAKSRAEPGEATGSPHGGVDVNAPRNEATPRPKERTAKNPAAETGGADMEPE